MSLSGGCANAVNITYKRLATMLAEKWEQPYCSTLAWMRCKLSFALLRSSIQCIRGARSACGHTFKQSPLPTDLVVAESNISLWTFTNFVKTIFILLYSFPRFLHHSLHLYWNIWGAPSSRRGPQPAGNMGPGGPQLHGGPKILWHRSLAHLPPVR